MGKYKTLNSALKFNQVNESVYIPRAAIAGKK